MLSVKEFYAESAWGWGFGEWGEDYTIVPGRHIGLDIARTGDVPALLDGVVTAVLLTSAMAWCVEVLNPSGWRLTYCHLSSEGLPSVGQQLSQGDRVGRLARGPRTLPLRDPDFPGTAWYGQHLHLVVSLIARAAWTLVAGRTLADFLDPTVIIREALASVAGVGGRPFPSAPIVLEDDMITIHAPNRGIALIGPGYYKSLTPEEAENSAAIVSKQVSGNDRQFDLWRQMALGGDS